MQEDLQMDLRESKSYLDQEMIRIIMGQMESALEILDYLYLVFLERRRRPLFLCTSLRDPNGMRRILKN